MPALANRILAAANVRLNRMDAAHAAIAALLKASPDDSIEKVRLNFQGKFSDPSDLERLLRDLRLAGLPE